MSVKIIVALIFAQDEHVKTIEQALEQAVAEVRGEPGCEQYDLHRDENENNRFVMIERWSDAAALERHLNAPSFKQLSSVIEGRATLEVLPLVKLV